MALSGLINSVCMLYSRIETREMTGAPVVAEFAGMFSSADLFSENVRSMLAIYKYINERIVDHVEKLPLLTSRRVILQMETTAYSEDEDKQAPSNIKGPHQRGSPYPSCSYCYSCRYRSPRRPPSNRPANLPADRLAHGDGPRGQKKLAYYIETRLRERD